MNKTKHLKELQKLWYKKLEEQGFRDIEQSDGRLREWDSFYFQHHFNPDLFRLKHHYYYQATQFLNHLRDNPETPELHIEIWHMHSEGMGVRQIALKLQARMDVILSKVRYNKDNIGEIVNSLKKAFNEFKHKDEPADPNS